ncbi:hypothetical protein CHU_2456 [Cytophaga hutchinsonii ATCC 33406]|uniref:PorV/PorQ family protein n=2 Tax=Cytophaga hutchinsonii TaxID=985 RepID=A0A6N4STG1_CYTH3|nr:hypothetical protein CHU_2456 [Cytophaga hutchinsonii ATCC 33406]
MNIFLNTVMKFFIGLALFVLTYFHHKSYGQDFASGARTRSLGSGCTADSTVWSLFNNPAGIASLKHVAVLISDEKIYGIQEIKNFSAGIICPLKKQLLLAASFSNQGYKWFNDQQIGIHAAHRKGPYSLGISFILWQRIAGETFRETYPLCNIGGTMSVNKHLQIGLHISNVSNTQNTVQTLPLRIKGGMLYKISNDVLFYADIIKQSNSNVFFSSGLEYRMHRFFYLRTGLQLKPMRLHGGAGFSSKRLSIDYSFSWQQPLGSKHQLSMYINLRKK